MPTAAFSIRAKDAVRDEHGNILVAYPDLALEFEPVVIVTPYYDTVHGPRAPDNKRSVPTVVSAGKRVAAIYDQSPVENYYINVLILDSYELNRINSFWGLAEIYPKPNAGVLEMDIVQIEDTNEQTAQLECANFLTPYWKDNNSSVRLVETVTPMSKGPSKTQVPTNSGNAASNYFVNHLSAELGMAYYSTKSPDGSSLIMLAETILAAKPGPDTTLEITWTRPYDSAPVVFATPHWVNSQIPVGYQETVVKSSATGCSVFSENSGQNYRVGLLAMPHGVPRIMEHDLEQAFKTLNCLFPGHKDQINAHKSELTGIILRGQDPSQALTNLDLQDHPAIGLVSSDSTALARALAKVLLDFLKIILTAAGFAIEKKKWNTALNELERVTKRLNGADKVVSAARAIYNSPTSDLRSKAIAILKAAEVIFQKEVLHVVLVLISIDKLKWYEWIEEGLKLAAIVASLVALAAVIIGSDGVAAPVAVGVWIGRLIKVIEAAKEVDDLVGDCKTLIDTWELDQASS